MTEDFVDGLNEYNVWKFLAARMPQAHIIAPADIISRIAAYGQHPTPAYPDPLPANAPSGRDLFVWDLDPSELTRAERAYPEARVFGILRDVWCAAVTHTDVAPIEPAASAPAVHYAIVCAGRSGSSFLCDLLRQAGLGDPAEHVRDFFVALCRRGYTFDELMSAMIRRGARGGYFGTKLIHHYIYPFREDEGPPEVVRRFLRRRDFRIIRLMRDPAEQAISSYFAHKTGIWHLYGREISNARHDAVPFDLEQLTNTYRLMCGIDDLIAEFVSSFGSVHEIDYADLDRDPRATLATVAAFLGAPAKTVLRIDLTQTEQKISARQPRMQEYLSRLRREVSLVPTQSAA